MAFQSRPRQDRDIERVPQLPRPDHLRDLGDGSEMNFHARLRHPDVPDLGDERPLAGCPYGRCRATGSP